MKRKIIVIDQEKCTGCGLCVSDCPEGALRVIDGKARLVGDLLCDGLGACLKSCPEDAISVIEREAEPYDEVRVLENIIPQGRNVLEAHLEHLRSHGQSEYLEQALSYLSKHRIAVSAPREISSCQSPAGGGCPGSRSQAFVAPQVQAEDGSTRPSQLTHWPIQMHLISPAAPHFRNSDLVIAADCVAFSLGDFHKDYLKGRTLTIACPKLDQGQEAYQDKITALIDQAEVKSIDVMIMQVPCCSGLLRHVVEAAGRAKRRIPVRCVVVGLRGEILREMPVPIDQPSQPKALSLV
jgi:NAD-dependent dihydropyrimidine dehydrogenase PreA subunit